MRGAVVQWCGAHKGREHAFIVVAYSSVTRHEIIGFAQMPRETRRQIIVSGGSEGETRQWMSWCQEAADRATVPTTPLETSPKHSSVEPTPSKVEEARREVEPSGVEPVDKKAAEHTGGGLLSEDYTRYLPKEPAKGIEGLLRFVRCGYQGNDMCVV